MVPSDNELAERLCRCDSNAFELLSTRYREVIYRHVWQTVRDDAATEDVVQEVFLRVWLHAKQWSGQGTFKSWLFRIATNLALNHIRSMRRHRQLPLEIPNDALTYEEEPPVPGWMIDANEPGPEQRLETAERYRLLHQLINRLPEEKREVLYLLYDDALETRQIAETLGIPEGTVKSRLHYATKRLAQEWKGLAKEWEDMA